MVFITEMWAVSSSGTILMTSWEQKVAALSSSMCSCLQGVLGRPDTLFLWALCLCSLVSGQTPIFLPLLDAVRNFFQFFCFALAALYLLLRVSLPKPHVLGSSAGISYSLILASASSALSSDGFTSLLFTTFWFTLAHQCAQSFLVVFWLSCLPPGWSCLSSPLQGSAMPICRHSLRVPGGCFRSTPPLLPSGISPSVLWANVFLRLCVSPILLNFHLKTISPYIGRGTTKGRNPLLPHVLFKFCH